MAVKQILGKVTVTPKGEYSSSETYKRLDIVTSNGQSYIAKVDNTGVSVTDTNTWLQLVEKPEKGIDYFTEEDIAQLVSMVTDDSESEFNEYYNGKVSDFDSNASSKTSEFNSNYDEKVESFNTIFDTSTDNFDGNYETKLSAFNENASTQTSTFNSVVEQATSDFNSNASTLTETFNTNASEKTSAFNINASEKTQEFNDNVDEKTEQITSQLDNYVQFDDYATNNKTGVINGNINGFQVSSSGNPYAKEYTAEEYDSVDNQDFIGKGTLENIKDDYVGSSTPVQDLTATVTNVQNDQDESMPKQTASGEIVSVDDALAYKTFNVTVDGESEQVTTTGKNKLLNNAITSTINGISFTVNDDKSVTLNGTATAQTDFLFLSEQLNLEGEYTFSISDTGQTGVTIQYGVNGVGIMGTGTAITKYTTTFPNNSLGSEYSYINMCRVRVASGVTCNNYTIYPMIESGSSKTSYEPYTGGQPSPSPDYPQEISTLTFDKITRCGKNLFDKDTVPDLLIYPHTDRLNSSTDNYSAIFKCLPNTTYSISKTSLSTTSLIVCGTKDYPETGDFPLNRQVYSNSNIANGYTTTEDTNYLVIRYCNPEDTLSHSEIFSTIQIEFGPQATDYEAYQATEYTIDLQGNEMVELPNGVKDELVIDKYGNVNLIKNVGKVIYTNMNNFSNNGQNNKRIQYLTPVIENIPLSYGDQLDNIFKSNVISSIYVQDGTSFAGTTATSKIRVSISREFLNIQEESNSGYLNALDELLQSLNESGNPFTIYYPLAEPQPISLGKLSDIITTLNGTNNISINGNIPTTISTTYALDIKKYIDNKLAEISSAMIEEG